VALRDHIIAVRREGQYTSRRKRQDSVGTYGAQTSAAGQSCVSMEHNPPKWLSKVPCGSIAVNLDRRPLSPVSFDAGEAQKENFPNGGPGAEGDTAMVRIHPHSFPPARHLHDTLLSQRRTEFVSGMRNCGIWQAFRTAMDLRPVDSKHGSI
jgi:hypothetical protein